MTTARSRRSRKSTQADTPKPASRAGGCRRPWWWLALCVVLLGMVAPTKGQSPPDPASLEDPAEHAAYVNELAAKSQAEKAEAVVWAHEFGMPVRSEDEHRVMELMAVRDGRPVYYVTTNIEGAVALGTNRVRRTAPWDLDGAGLAVGIWDSAGVLAEHQEFIDADGQSRIKVRDSHATASHATHVAGTIAAAGIDPLAQGMAPRVRIESYNWNDDTAQMAVVAARAPGESGKIYVSNHSYGIMAGWEYGTSGGVVERIGWHWLGEWAGPDSWEDWFGQYNSIAREWDEVAYLHPYYLAFAAAGNDRNDKPEVGDTVYYWLGSGWKAVTYDPTTCALGDGEPDGGYDTVSGAAVAKNIITVGAVADAVSGDARSLAHATMPPFSSWGPTDDGRIKPDIVANGVQVYSTDHDFTNDYRIADGTSMASPTACGSAILLVQHYGRLFPGQAMRASALKGLILHTADDLGRPGPDYEFGWGLMNTKAAVELISRSCNDPLGPTIREDFLDGDDTDDSYYIQANTEEPIRLTLCWTDPPVRATQLHNDPTLKVAHDLDLRLIGPDGRTTYYPYILDPAQPSEVAGTGDNKYDNVEQIYIPTPSKSGTYEVRISYKGTLTQANQYYALISDSALSDHRAPEAEDALVSASTLEPTSIDLKATDDGLPETPGALTYVITSLPAHGTLAYADGTPITEPTALVNFGHHVVYRADAGFYGADRFTFCADDGGATPWGGPSKEAAVTLIVQNFVTVEYQVGRAENDAYGLAAARYQKNSSEQLLVGQYSSAMRFSDIDIPAGSEIVSAHLKLCVDGDTSAPGLLEAEASGNATSFASGNPRFYERPRTSASIAWDCQGSGNGYNWQISPNFGAAVQEVVDRSDWSAGHSLVVLFSPRIVKYDGLVFAAYEESPGYAARLEIAYTPPSDDGSAPTLPPGQDIPVARSDAMVTATNSPVEITLAAVDDGWPQPLTYTLASLPEHGTLNHQGRQLTAPGSLAAFADHVVYVPDVNFTGDDSFTFYADDGGSPPFGGTSNLASVTIEIRDLVTRRFEVLTADDDAYETQGHQYVSSDLLAVGRSSSAMRFRNVDIPQGSEIITAHLQLCLGTTPIERSVGGILEAEAVDHAADFLGADRAIAGLPRTEAAVVWEWDVIDPWPGETYCSSPNIAAVVQEIIDRPEWHSGHAIAILYSALADSGQELEFFACQDTYTDRAARLEITYARNPNAEPLSAPTLENDLPVAEDMEFTVAMNAPLTIHLQATDDGRPTPPGRLTYAVTALPEHGSLVSSSGAAITEPIALADFDNTVVYISEGGFTGVDTFTFYADDREGTSETRTVTINVRDAVAVEYRIQASADDGAAIRSETSNRLRETTLRVGPFSSGMRFQNIDLLRGAEIVSARLKVHTAGLNLDQPLETTLRAEATGNAADFAGAGRHVCHLATLPTSIPWLWEAGSYDGWYSSPDVGSMIQQIIDRPGWSSGHAVALLCSATEDAATELAFEAYDGDPDHAARLEIMYIPQVEPMSYWQFDEGQGNTLYDKVGNRHGKLRGPQWTSGHIAGALEFDGVNDYVELPSNDILWLPRNDFAVTFWTYFNTGEGSPITVGQEMILDLNCGDSIGSRTSSAEDVGYGVRRRWIDGGITFQMTTVERPNEDLDSNALLAANQWYHVAVVRNGSSQEIYINGELDSQRTCSTSPVDFSGSFNDSNVSFGQFTMEWPKHDPTPRAYHNGKLDEVMMFDRGLSARQVRRIYWETSGVSSEPTPPTADDMAIKTSVNTAVAITLSATDDYLPDPPGLLTYVLASLPAHGTLEYPDGARIIQAGALADHGNQLVYRPAEDYEGPDHFTFYVDDSGSAPTGGLSNTATVSLTVRPAPQPVMCEFEIKETVNDAYAAPAASFNTLGGEELLIGLYTIGLRFTDVSVPSNSTILSANVEMCRLTRRVEDYVDGVVEAEAADNPGDFAGSDRHICHLESTTASVSWPLEVEDSRASNDIPNVGWGHWCTSPDLSAVIQEVVDRPGWSAGNALVLKYGTSSTHSGQNVEFYSLDHRYHPMGAKLRITYLPE